MRRTPSPHVTASSYVDIFNDGVRQTVRLKVKLLRKYVGLPFGKLPRDYGTDLRSFCVLVSATIEQCAEDLVWAHYHELSAAILSAVAPPTAALQRAASLLRFLGENQIDRLHGIGTKQFTTLSELVDHSPTLTPAQKDSFRQLAIARNESAHTYAVTYRDPNDVWSYTMDLLTATRHLAIHCAGSNSGLISI